MRRILVLVLLLAGLGLVDAAPASAAPVVADQFVGDRLGWKAWQLEGSYADIDLRWEQAEWPSGDATAVYLLGPDGTIEFGIGGISVGGVGPRVEVTQGAPLHRIEYNSPASTEAARNEPWMSGFSTRVPGGYTILAFWAAGAERPFHPRITLTLDGPATVAATTSGTSTALLHAKDFPARRSLAITAAGAQVTRVSGGRYDTNVAGTLFGWYLVDDGAHTTIGVNWPGGSWSGHESLGLSPGPASGPWSFTLDVDTAAGSYVAGTFPEVSLFIADITLPAA